VKYSNLMAPQWKIDIDDPVLLKRIVAQLEQSQNLTQQIPCFDAELGGNSICLGARREQKMTDKIELITCAGPQQFLASELLDGHSGVVKSGRHHPKGVLLMHGTSIRENIRIDRCDNLDIAPTLLRLLNRPIPSCMRGRVLEEALFTNKVEMSATAR
jgi:hypothetical protein